MVTISRLSRTFMRGKGGTVAVASFHSSVAQPGRARRWVITALIPSAEPAIVPFTPSCASSSVPLTPCFTQTSSSAGLIDAGSSKRVK